MRQTTTNNNTKKRGGSQLDRLVALILILGIYVSVVPMVLNELRFTTKKEEEDEDEFSDVTTTQRERLIDLPRRHEGGDEGRRQQYYYDVLQRQNNSNLKQQKKKKFDLEYKCDAQSSPAMLPQGNVIRRSLHAVIIGTMKGGTQALHATLTKYHPKILSTGKMHGELHYFTTQGLRRNLPEDHPGYPPTENNNNNITDSRIRIPRQDLRDGFEYVIKDRAAFQKRRQGNIDIANDTLNSDKVGIHSAPLYLFLSRSVAARLMCVCPWTKIIVLLRNPIDRAFSHYNFILSQINPDSDSSKHHVRVPPTFDQFVQDDIQLLTNMGVIRKEWKSQEEFDNFAGSHEEYEAWERYVPRAKHKGPVGRGLYVIQLEIYMEEFIKVNKSIKDDLLVLQSEETRENTLGAYQKTVDFLGLEQRMPRRGDSVFNKDHHTTKYTHEGISDETYKLLYNLFEPYNTRLAKLLGDDWVGVWDDNNV